MNLYAAELEGGGALCSERLEQILESFEQRVHCRKRVEIVDNRLGHVMDDRLRNALVSHQHIDYRELRAVFDHAAKNILLHRHAAIEGNLARTFSSWPGA